MTSKLKGFMAAMEKPKVGTQDVGTTINNTVTTADAVPLNASTSLSAKKTVSTGKAVSTPDTNRNVASPKVRGYLDAMENRRADETDRRNGIVAEYVKRTGIFLDRNIVYDDKNWRFFEATNQALADEVAKLKAEKAVTDELLAAYMAKPTTGISPTGNPAKDYEQFRRIGEQKNAVKQATEKYISEMGLNGDVPSQEKLQERSSELETILANPEQTLRPQIAKQMKDDLKARDYFENASQTEQDLSYIGENLALGANSYFGGIFNAVDGVKDALGAKEDVNPASLFGQTIPGVIDTRSQFEKVLDQSRTRLAVGNQYVNDAVEFIGGFAQGLGYSGTAIGIGSLLTYATGGAGAPAAASGIAKIGQFALNTLKNPHFWATAIPTYGNSYKQALSEGATTEQAQIFALANGVANGAIEQFGLQSGGTGLAVKLFNLATEGIEETAQGSAEQLIKKLIYEPEIELWSLTDKDAVVSVSRGSEEFTMGLLMAGFLGGGSKMVDTLYANAAYMAIAEDAIAKTNGDKKAVAEAAIQLGLTTAPGTDTYAAAVKMESNLKAGKLPSTTTLGRLLVESQSPEAVKARRCYDTTLQSAEAVGADVEAAQPVAQVAARFGRQVEFVPAEQLQVVNEATGKVSTAGGRWTSDGVLQLNASLLNENADVLLNEFLKHELTHSIEGTAGWETLVRTVRRSMGETAWQQAVADVRADRQARGDTAGTANPEAEVIANWVGKNLYTNNFIQIMTKGNKKAAGRLVGILDKMRLALGGEGKSLHARQLAALERVFLKALENGEVNAKVDAEGQYDFNDNLGQQLQDWLAGGGKANGTYNGEYFELGTTPAVLVKHGARERTVIMLPECIVKITGGKHSISLSEIAKLPSELNDPVLLFKGSVPNSFVALTELVDKHGNDVVAAIHINRHQDRLKVHRIASLYSKSDDYGNNHIENYVHQQIAAGNLLDASTKKAPMWFTSRGLQLPKLVQTIIDANTFIPQNGGGVNTQSMQNGGNYSTAPAGTSASTPKQGSGQNAFLSDRQAAELDNTYMQAVEQGDTRTAQRMVDEAARKAGYAHRVYHGTPRRFTSFDKRQRGSSSTSPSARIGFWLTTSRETAEFYSTPGDGAIAAELKSRQKAKAYYAELQNLLDEKYTPAYEALRNEIMYGNKTSPSMDYLPMDAIAEACRTYLPTMYYNLEDIWPTGTVPTAANRYHSQYAAVKESSGVFLDYLRRNYHYDGASRNNAQLLADFLDEIENGMQREAQLELGVMSPTTMALYAKAENPLVVTEHETPLGNINRDDVKVKTIRRAVRGGHDSVIIKDIIDGGAISDHLVVFHPEQIKSADPVTYDDKGRVIPLSQRFNPKKSDTRYAFMPDDLQTEPERAGGISASADSIIDLSADNELSRRIGNKRGSEKYKVIQEYIFECLGGDSITLSDGKNAVVDNRDVQHISKKAGVKKIAQISEIKRIIENARLIAEESSTKERKFDHFYYYEAVVKLGRDTYPIFVNVGRARNDSTYHVYDITQKLRDTAHRIDGVGRPVGIALKSGISNDSISETGESVKGNSADGQYAFLSDEGEYTDEGAVEGRLEELAKKLGDAELNRRMYMAMQMDKLPATVTLEGAEMDTAAYLEAVERTLPDNRAELKAYIAKAEQRLAQEMKKAYEEGDLAHVSNLPVNLQLFTARRKLELELARGEDGSQERRFFWQRTRGLDVNKAHEEELLAYLEGRSETYNPIANQKTLDKATDAMRRPGYVDDLVKRLGRSNPKDLFTEVEMAAAMVLINDAKNDGDLELYADLVQGLSRKGTQAGRAVQILAMQAMLTPEGTIRAAQRTLRKETDRVYGEGTSESVDVLVDTVVDAVERAAEANERNVPKFKETADFSSQIDNWETLTETGYVMVGDIPAGSPLHQVGLPAGKLYFDVSKIKKAMVDHGDHLSTDILKQIPELLKNPIAIVEYKPGEGTNTVNVYGDLYYHGTPVTVGLVVTLSRDGSVVSKVRTVHARSNFAKQITDDSILYLGENKNETDSWFQAQGQLVVPMRGTIYGFIRSIAQPFGNVNPQTEQELTDELTRRVAQENDPYITEEQIRGILERAVANAKDMPAHLKKMLQSDETIANLADRIAEVQKNGHLNVESTRRVFEEALNLPHLTAEDVGTLAELVNKMTATEEGTAQRLEAEEAIYRFLGSKLKVTKLELLQAWRKFAMLANPKTHIRNFTSTGVMTYGVQKLDTAFSTLLQRLTVDEAARTAYLGWSHTEHGQAIRPALDKAAEAAMVRMKRGGGKYDIAATRLAQYKKYFGTSKAGEVLNKANNINSNLLEVEDAFFFRRAYVDALGQIMTARGMTEVTQEADELAYERALDATFRAENAINDVLVSLKRHAQSSKTGWKLFGNAVDVIIPFTKTPANITVSTIQHSPVGIVKGAWDIAQATKTGDASAKAAAINTVAKGMTGTALLALGLLLGSLGLFNTGFGKTEKERAADELAGIQENSLVIGGASITLDWLQPAASPLIIGCSMAQRLKEDGLSLGTVFGAVMDGTDSLFELSMLQSLYDVLGGYDAGASASLGSIGENLISQSIPTLVGQAARAIDPVQRKTKGDSGFETMLNRVLAKIPGLTYLLEPELDVWGEDVYRTGKADGVGALLNVFQQFILPSNIKRAAGEDAISQEILRLYEEVGSSAIPSALSRDDAADHGLDYTAANRQLGRANRQAIEDFMMDNISYTVQTEMTNGRKKSVSKTYSEMTDDERRRVISRISKKAKEQFTTEENETDKYWIEIMRRVQDGT